MESEVKIAAEPMSTPSMCRFTVDRPAYANASAYFGSSEQAELSPLAKRLFAIGDVAAVLISHNQITVTKRGFEDWRVIGKQVGGAIRTHIASGEPAVEPSLREKLPPADEIRGRVQRILENEINPAVAAHGGVVRLIDVRENIVYLQLGGGCQGCGMADVTLKQGIETAIRASVPEVGDILDITDHASGRNPYYTPSRK